MRRLSLILIVLIICFAAGLPAVQTTGKMPITTSSEKARQFYLQGLDYSDKLRGFDSLEYFKKATTEDPQMAIAYLNYALSAPTTKEFFENLNKAVSLAGKVSDGERMWIEAVQAGASGQTAKQVEIYQNLAAAYPGDERVHSLLGGVYFILQEWEKSIDEYDKSVRINPKFSPPYNLMGYAYRSLEKYSDAEKAFKTYIELIPNDPNPYDSYAELLMKIGRFDESNAQYRKALSVDPHFINSYLAIATNLDFKGEYDKARKELQSLLGSARNDGESRAAFFAISVSYAFQRDWVNALAEQEKAHALAQKIGDAGAMAGDLFVMGTILLESGRADEAKQKFDLSAKAIADSKLSDEVKENSKRNHLFNLGTVALSKNDLATAKKLSAEFSKQAEAAKNRFQIWQSHELAGRIAMAEKNYTVALAELQKSNVQNPQNLYRMAQAYEASGNQAKAKEMYKKVAEFNVLNSLNYAFVRNDAIAKM